MTDEPTSTSPSMPASVRAWFVWAFVLLAITGLALPRIVAFIDFSERAPFSILGIFMMIELAVVLFGITVALQRKRIAYRFAIGISLLPVPILAALPPVLLDMPPEASNGWFLLMAPIGLLISAILVVGLLRSSSREWFSEP